VLANCLLDGLTTLSLRHGTMSDWINALEVVLPTGEIVRTGGAAFGVPPVARAPAPGLQGLFVSAQGTTGIAVRGTLQLWHEAAHAERWVCMTDSLERAYGLARELVALDCCDDLGVLTSAVARLICGERDPLERDPTEPEGVVVVEIGAATDRQFRARWADFAEQVGRLRRRSRAACSRPLAIADLVAVEPGFAALSDLPARFDALLDRGGLSWVGTYGPMRGIEVASRRALAVLAEHGLPPLVVMRPMKGGHFAVLRLIEVFDRDDAEQVERVRRANLAISDVLWDQGYVPYKTPPALLHRHRHRLDPGFVALWNRVRKACDPAGICNPGRWAP
jgi:FAD/FMN-containing dehydrogenase